MRTQNAGGRIFLLILAAVITSSITASAARTYRVDPVHSMALFSAKRFNVSQIHGRFHAISGTIVTDQDDIEKSSVEIEIKTESVDTGNGRRDTHLRSPDFFNVKQFPVMKFKSTQVKKTGENSFEITGDMTIHGVTKSVTATAELIGSSEGGRGGSLIGFETTFTLKRSDFGMNFMTGGIGDEIKITLAIQGLGQ